MRTVGIAAAGCARCRRWLLGATEATVSGRLQHGLLRQLQLSVARAKMHELSRQLEAAEARLAEQEKLNVRSAVR